MLARPRGPLVISEGLRWGAVMSALAVVLAVLGLTPSLSWLPEVPLLAVAVLLPVAVYGLAGYRAGLDSGRLGIAACSVGLAQAAFDAAIGGDVEPFVALLAPGVEWRGVERGHLWWRSAPS